MRCRVCFLAWLEHTPQGLPVVSTRCLAAEPLELALIETAAVWVQDIISLHKPHCSECVGDTKGWDKAVLIRDMQGANTSLLAQVGMLDVLPSEVPSIAAVAMCCSCFAERLWVSFLLLSSALCKPMEGTERISRTWACIYSSFSSDAPDLGV